MTTAPDDGVPVVPDGPPVATPVPLLVLVDEDGDLHCPTCSHEVVRVTIARDCEVVGWDFGAQYMDSAKSYNFEVTDETFHCDNNACPTDDLQWEDPSHPTFETNACRHCEADVFRSVADGTWLDPNAPLDGLRADGTWEPGHPTDDAIWRETCPDNHEDRAAAHEPV